MKQKAAWLAFGGLGYALTLLLVGQVASANGFLAGIGLQHNFGRFGAYDSRLSQVAAVDPTQMANAVSEASGGPPTIASPPPASVIDPDADQKPEPSESKGTSPAQKPEKPAPVPNPPAQVLPPVVASYIASLPPNYQAQATSYFLSLSPTNQAQVLASLQQKQKPEHGG
ncbi:MAG TPA: hypothetical protein VM674_02175 [Candidatus Acidoferrum sp.]|nr:hypothetical protein [Candidatus Acidoferrum sp.]